MKVITGDNGTVAAKVCRDIGLEVDGALTGAEIGALNDVDLAAAIPNTTVFATDRVDPEVLARPAAWDIGFVRRYMGVFGSISSLFDFATFFVMLRVLHANHAEFPERLVR